MGNPINFYSSYRNNPNFSVDALTVLLLHMEDPTSSFVDSSTYNHVMGSTAGAIHSTAQFKYGSKSAVFSNGNISSVDSNDWYFAAGDWTIDGWFYFNAPNNTRQAIASQWKDNNNYWLVDYDGVNGKLNVTSVFGGVVIADYFTYSSIFLSSGVWYHLAFVRYGSYALVFIDGIVQFMNTNNAFGTSDMGNVNADLSIGTFAGSGFPFSGYMDDVRISKGVARWIASFFTPTDTTPGGQSNVPIDFYNRVDAQPVNFYSAV